jgi:AAA domain-containing protein/DNA primase RepB-like protein
LPTAIDLCSLAWSGQEGYVCISVRDPTIDKQQSGYWKDLTFKWPEEKARVRVALKSAEKTKKDVYWAPAVFEAPTRTREAVKKVTTLWSDLDTVDPKTIPGHLKPTAAWETSPGRWQALWQLDKALPAKQQSQLNQRLTYALQADKGGWDLTQVLRLPDTPNHKYPKNPKVKLLWMNGHSLDATSLMDDLPEVEVIDAAAIDKAELLDQRDVLKNHSLSSRAKELIKARHAQVGTRSDRLWELECLLAEKGLEPREIVSVVRPTVWNKFEGRRDELERLFYEASKAAAHVEAVTADIQQDTLEEVQDATPLSWVDFDRDHVAIRWMVADLWGEAEVGFISGHPKSYKSWLALDLAVSVATGTRFLGTFATRKHNVLLVQEEDPKPLMQERLSMVAAAKGLLAADIQKDGTIDVTYDLPDNLFIISNQGFTVNDEWLEMLEAWIFERDIKLVILDPLMMMGEDFDEFKAFEFMAKVLKPLKRLRARTQSAIAIVHHHIKGSNESGARAMYGSVALWAWEEAALHLSVTGVGKLVAERFSKHELLPPVTITIGDMKELWHPEVAKLSTSNLYDVLATIESGATIEELMNYTNIGRDAIDRQLKELEKKGVVKKIGKQKRGTGRPHIVWGVSREQAAG